jgi:glycosyltransferase involved in cell wall biosynthesis
MSKTVAVLSSHTPSLFWFRVDMMQEFARRGYKVYALGNEPEEEWTEKFAEKGINYLQINVKRNGLNPFQDRKTLKSVKKLLKEIKPDKIFTYQAKTVIYGTLAARSAGITEVYPLIAGMGSMFLSNSLKSRIVRFIMTLLYRKSIGKCPAVFFQNRDDEQIFRDSGIIKRQKVVLIHGSGVNTEKFEAAPLPEKAAFLCISRLIRDKGVYEYLEACKKIKSEYNDVRCLLVGPYDTNPSALKPEEVQPFIDAGVEYFGEQEAVRPYLEQCSVFVLPSYREGTPKTNLEAMACARAVITTDAPGCKETVTDGENGFLVPVKDVDAIYEKMKYCIEHPEEVKAMGEKGRALAKELYDVKKVNEQICSTMGI